MRQASNRVGREVSHKRNSLESEWSDFIYHASYLLGIRITLRIPGEETRRGY
jgi:hypothetical protein